LPKCYIGWIGGGEKDPYPEGTTVSTPIYHTLDREKLLVQINVPSQGDPGERVISGTALFLSGES